MLVYGCHPRARAELCLQIQLPPPSPSPVPSAHPATFARAPVAYLVGAFETRRDDLVDDVHQVLGFAYDMVDFDEGGCLADGRLFDGEL